MTPSIAKVSYDKSNPLINWLSINKDMVMEYLKELILTNKQREVLGYPIEERDGVSFTVTTPGWMKRRPSPTSWNVKAQDFNPSEMWNSACGQDDADTIIERNCSRCGKGFLMTSDFEYMTTNPCSYHPGRIADVPPFLFTCCQGEQNAPACTHYHNHVWSGVVPGLNGPFQDYERTKASDDASIKIYGLDNEMCYTSRGLEVARVSVVALDGSVVYDEFVKTTRPVICYNTLYSGVTAQDLVTAKGFNRVRSEVMRIITADTILVGHGLENDLRSLKIVHNRVIDTAVLYPHFRGLPYRRSLKDLAASYLERQIQTRNDGHLSVEDANASVDLLLLRLRNRFPDMTKIVTKPTS